MDKKGIPLVVGRQLAKPSGINQGDVPYIKGLITAKQLVQYSDVIVNMQPHHMKFITKNYAKRVIIQVTLIKNTSVPLMCVYTPLCSCFLGSRK